ncbi:MAG: ABC transporter ATP-binding protein [Thermoanaerobaculia bacterium]
MNLAIETIGLVKRYGALTALDSINLVVQEGVSYGLVGANGAGKTTTARLLAGLSTPTRGSVRILGEPIHRQSPALRRRIGVMPEGLALFDYLTGREYLAFIGRLYLLDSRVAQTRAEELLQLMDIAEAGGRLIAGYSYGMKKKLALAAAMLHRPELLILDEPLEGVDTVSRTILERIFAQLSGYRVTVFVTSNSLRLVERICSRVGILDKGRLVLEGSLDELLKRGSAEERSLETLFLETADVPQSRPSSIKWS